MKKRTFILLLLIVLLLCALTACTPPSSNPQDEAATEMADFKPIEGKEHLAYNMDTRVVYYMFSTYEANGYQGYGYTYFAPYISENGKFCRYINDEIVEINEVAVE